MAPSGALHRLIYTSSAMGVLRADELDRILLRAKAFNSNSGITGFLLFHEGTFLQVIEGSPGGVLSLMERIRRDRRHANLTPLESQPCAARAFPSWNMGYVAQRNFTTGQRQDFCGLLAAQRQGGHAPCAHTELTDRLWSFLSSFQQSEAA